MRGRIAALVATAGAVGAATLLALADPGTGQDGQPSTTAQPVLGVADVETVLMGSSPQSEPSEAWAYRRLPLDVAPPKINGTPLEFGDPGSATNPDPQLAFLRHRADSGWRVFETPVKEDGTTPFRGMIDNPRSGRMTPRAGGLLVGRDTRAPSGQQLTVLLRDPGKRFRVLADPPPAVLLVGEALATDSGTGAIATAAYDGSGEKTGAFFGVTGPDEAEAVVHWDGTDWVREPVCLPPAAPPVAGPPLEPCPFEADTDAAIDTFEILAISATTADNAWMLARVDADYDRGIVLYERRTDGANGVRWEERDLNQAIFSDVATPAEDVTEVAPLDGNADPLTATADGVWIDGSLLQAGDEYDFTLYFDPGSGLGEVTKEWCDAPAVTATNVCDERLGVRFSRGSGYRSLAWGGAGFGTRIVTNPVDVGGDDQTNRGTYLAFDGQRFRRRPGASGNQRRSGAFASLSEGWIEGPTHITAAGRSRKLARWPVALRSPLTAVAPQPGVTAGSISAQALAAGQEGTIARYVPGTGWTREFLLTSSGTVAKPTLRGVAWPEADRAYAVGDLGNMWLWRADTGLWERDPAAPIGFESNLMGVAFDVADPQRGYAVGKEGALLRYDKTWTQEALPLGFEGANFTQVAFAGRQAIVAAGSALLVNDGGAWRVDQGVADLLAPFSIAGPQLYAVAGLPDGGAVAAGRNFVIVRDSAGGPWRFSDQPLPGSTVIALGAFREGGSVRALASIVPRITYPPPDEVPIVDPNVPTPIVPPFPLPGEGYLLRETASGWNDEQLAAFAGTGTDRPLKADPVLGLVVDGSGEGWAVGGWSGEVDTAGRGNSGRGGAGKADRARVQTGGIFRYSTGGAPAGPPAATAGAVPLENAPIRFAVGGHAACEQPCVDLEEQDLAPDRTLSRTLENVERLAAQPNGPRAFLYAGGRLPATGKPMAAREADRIAVLLSQRAGLPVYGAASAGDASGGSVTPYTNAFQAFSAPFGNGAMPSSVQTGGIPGAAPGQGARTHYAFDSLGSGGTVRVVVIDNSAGSLAASDPHQNPAEPQKPWLQAVLADAKARQVPVVVMGSRDLNTRFSPRLNVATDGDEIAQLLVDGGASAYFFERPEENRSFRIPAGAPTTIPSYGTGTLGYRSPLSNVSGQDSADAIFGDTGFLIAEIDGTRRDAATNVAPVTVRLIPVVDDVSLQAVDGTLIRRSRVALFQGLGRRPTAGDRWGRIGGGDPQPPGGDPYTSFPPALCFQAGCGTRITPEYRFTSSRPDIGDFVKVDPNTTNLRKPVLDGDKTVSDSSSGLFCAFNSGRTTVTVSAGGLSYQQVITVLGGSVQRPCGTRPRDATDFERPAAPVAPATPPPPAAAPAVTPTPTPAPPPPPTPAVPVVAPVPVVVPKAVVPKPAPIPPPPPIVPAIPPVPIAPADLTGLPPTSPVPPPPAIARPIPPGGAVARVYQVEKEEEQEAAPEQQSAFSAYEPQNHTPTAPFVLGFVVLAAFAGAVLHTRNMDARRERRRRRPRPSTAWATTDRPQQRRPPGRRNRYR